MSLLIDALKRAEEAKRRAAASEQSNDAPEFSRQATAHREAGEPATPGRPGAASSAPAHTAAAAQALNLFEVKGPRRRIGFALGVGLLTLLASLLIAIYFWMQLRPSGVRLNLPPEALQATPENPMAAPPATPEASPPPARTPLSVSRSGPRASEPLQRVAPNRGSLGTSAAAPMVATEPREPTRRPIPVVRRSVQPAIPAPLAEAWAAYQAGALERAERLYREVLGDDPLNLDALNGMGAIALRSARPDEAIQWFGRTLAAQPGNAVALAGLAGLQGRGAGVADDSRLRALIAERPREAALHFALGNALAREQRWGEAQSSYFEAYDLDRENPDYLFNLAVSLDHLGQRAHALRFYSESLRSGAQRPHAFADDAARRRIDALSAN